MGQTPGLWPAEDDRIPTVFGLIFHGKRAIA
jgi:hypothetical protein